jgi:cytochrome c556
MKAAGLLTALACGSLATFGQAQEPDAAANALPHVSIKEVMEKTITPATNVLWNALEPPTDEQWAALEEAAVTLLVAANAIAVGGTGPMDADWVKQPAWQAFDRLMIVAGMDALKAVRARDLAALMTAGDALYTSCEGCHAQFNPGVVGAQ